MLEVEDTDEDVPFPFALKGGAFAFAAAAAALAAAFVRRFPPLPVGGAPLMLFAAAAAAAARCWAAFPLVRRERGERWIRKLDKVNGYGQAGGRDATRMNHQATDRFFFSNRRSAVQMAMM